MSEPITHERCSELLGPLLRGELDERTLRSVEAHLDSCEECRAELSGLRALAAGDDAGALRDDERAALHSTVRAAARSENAGAGVPAPDTSRRRRGIGTLISAAALLLVLIFGVVGALTGGDVVGGGGSGGGAEEAGREAGGPEVAADRPQAGGPGPRFVLEGRLQQALRSSDTETSATKTDRLGSRSALFSGFARAYDASDARRLRDTFLDSLATQAPERSVAAQVRECSRVVFDAQDFPTLPAYATLLRRDGDRSLLLGYAWTDGPGGLDRYMFWTFPQGSCDDLQATYRAGPIGD